MSEGQSNGTTEYSIRVNRKTLFDALRKMKGDTSAAGSRLIECLLSGEVGFQDAIGLQFYGIELSLVAEQKEKTEAE